MHGFAWITHSPKVRSEWSVTWCELDPPVLEAFNACSSRHLFFLKWAVMIPIDSLVTSVYISNNEVGIQIIQWLNPKEKVTQRYKKSFTMQLWIKLEAKSFHGLPKAAGVPQEFPSVRVMTCIGWFRLLTAWVRSRRRDQDSFHGQGFPVSPWVSYSYPTSDIRGCWYTLMHVVCLLRTNYQSVGLGTPLHQRVCATSIQKLLGWRQRASLFQRTSHCHVAWCSARLLPLVGSEPLKLRCASSNQACS